MGSMGILLADWSIELIRSRKRKAKQQKKNVNEKQQQECSAQTEAYNCISCREKTGQISLQSERISKYESERNCLTQIIPCDDSTGNVVESVENIVKELSILRGEVEQLQKDGLRMGESVGRQLSERDDAHSERVRSLEIMMAEKEKQLIQSAQVLRQQLAAAKREIQQLQRQLENMGSDKRVTAAASLEQEVDSLRMVLDMKKQETEQLKAANNSLILEMERFGGLEVKLQVQMQQTEEMNAVINMKNEQLKQVLDEYDAVQEQLEVEVSAHFACQQELESSQWNRQNFLVENEKKWKDVTNQEKSGLILDVIQKEQAVAYSFNC